MSIELIANERLHHEAYVTERFLDIPNDESFTDLFSIFTPQLVAFFRARGCERTLAEDLTQEVMLKVYSKAAQIRDRALFRGWLFTIARNSLCLYYRKQAREVETVDLEDGIDRLVAASQKPGGTPAFEFRRWMDFLESHEREVMILRFVEQWEYHEIAAAQAIPIGTVQWRVFNAKKKLTPYLATGQDNMRRAA
jgi:RNA polymerase sigma-70 factor (ECF subfamily)